MSKLLGYEKKILAERLISAQINLINECTSKCKSCRKYTWPNDRIEITDVINSIKAMKSLGLETLVLSGGDPLCYGIADLLTIFNFCNANSILTSMITTLITGDKSLLDVMAQHLHRVHVSVDASSSELYKHIRGVDAFELVVENIKFVMQKRAKSQQPVRISCTVSKMNYYEVMDMYNLANELGCTINFYLVHTFDNLKMDDGEIDQFYRDMSAIAHHEKVVGKRISNAVSLITSKYDIPNKKPFVCHLPNHHCTINANGDIYPCCKLLNDNGPYEGQKRFAYGNIVGKDVDAIINELDRCSCISWPNKDKELSDVCGECGQRYDGLIEDLTSIKTNSYKPVFF